jgi:hypothetical protein
MLDSLCIILLLKIWMKLVVLLELKMCYK